jgi:lipoprotein-anchoring transpeptidase ErfK/SrfK
MADYYPLLRKAIDRLDQPTEAARYNVYERARQALVHQLRGAGIVDKQLDEHLESLDGAVTRIEREFSNGRKEPTRVLRAVPEEPDAKQGREEPQAAPPVGKAAPSPDEPPQQTPVVERAGESASVLRRWGAVMAAGVLLVVIAAAVSLYFFQPRQRPTAADRPAAPPAQSRPAPTPTAVASTQEAAQPSYVLRRQRVFYRTTHPPNTIAVSLSQKFLYVVQPNQVAIRYTIGVGPACDKVAGLFHVTEKVPRPSDSATGRAPTAPVMPAQHFSPPALYFDQGRAVHEAADPKAVGQLVRTGCFLTWEQDIADLFERVSLNDRVVVVN